LVSILAFNSRGAANERLPNSPPIEPKKKRAEKPLIRPCNASGKNGAPLRKEIEMIELLASACTIAAFVIMIIDRQSRRDR